MRVVLPGKAEAKLQAVSSSCWEDRQLVVSSKEGSEVYDDKF